jgi:ABC-type multidrug transport system fused ATPase/permease subunit
MSEIKYEKTQDSEKGYSRSVFETLWNAYRPYAGWIFISLIIGFIGRFALLGNANLIGHWVDSLCRENLKSTGLSTPCHSQSTFFAGWSSTEFIVSLTVLASAGFFLVLVFRVLFSRLSARAVSKIYDETTLRTSRQSMSFFDSVPAGRIITRFSSDYGNIFRLFGGPLAELFSIIFDLTSMVILISWASPYYLGVVVFMIAVNFTVYRMNSQRIRIARRKMSAARSPSIAHFAETAQGASAIRTFSKEQSFMDRFEKLDQHFRKNKWDATTTIFSFSFQINFATAFSLFLTGLLAIYLNQHGLISVGSIGVAFAFLVLSGGTIQSFFEWTSQFEEAMVGVERMDQFLRMPLEVGAKLPAETSFATNHPIRSESEQEFIRKNQLINEPSARLNFENVWLQYRPELPPVLKGISFQVEAGERLGIIGRTGSGKSSLIQALFYLYPLKEGRISINTQSPLDSQTDLQLYRKSISLIAQDPTLFRGTLRDNLDVLNQKTDHDLFMALQRVGLSDWAHTAGLNLSIEEKGRNLSQGERQLICMARCLLKDSPIVVMDEATSSVDPQSEEILVRATEEFFKGKTQLIIAHRLSTLVNCDRILWLKQGEVVMIGKPQEVLPIFQNSKL